MVCASVLYKRNKVLVAQCLQLLQPLLDWYSPGLTRVTSS